MKYPIPVVSSLQSLNNDTLKAIKRKNMPIDKYMELQNDINDLGLKSITNLIIPLPCETKESFCCCKATC